MKTLIHIDMDNIDVYEQEYGISSQLDRSQVYQTALENAASYFESRGIRATFFVIAKDLELKGAISTYEKLLQAGHEVANHSFNHPESWAEQVGDAQKLEMLKADQAIQTALKVKPLGFRAPGYAISPELIQELKTAGYTYDSSKLPGLGTLMISMYYALMGGSDQKTFGVKDNLFSRTQAYRKQGLWELPLAVFPILRLPLHTTFVYKFGLLYFKIAAKLCRWFNQDVILLFHAADFLNYEGNPDLSAKVQPLKIPLSEKNKIITTMLDCFDPKSFQNTNEYVKNLSQRPN